MKNITGSPVEGDNFFGREKELEFAWKQIQNGNSILLAAPRRVGKSSFAKKLLVNAKNEEWNTLEINFEQIKTEEGFVKLMVEKIQEQKWWAKTKNSAGKIVEDILTTVKPTLEFGGVKATIEYQRRKEDLYEKLRKLIDHSQNTLIMVDELTVLLSNLISIDKENGKKNAEFLLNWLRSFRHVTGSKIRWVFCSSVGIENFTGLHSLSYTLNDVHAFPLGAFTPSNAESFLTELSKSDGLALDTNDLKYILNKLGWQLPYFIQILFHKISYLVNVEDKVINTGTIDEAYDLLLEEKDLNTWDERLGEYLELEADLRSILNSLSGIHSGQNREMLLSLLYSRTQDVDAANQILSKVLTILKNDGYLISDPSGLYLFRSPLLRDFWFRRYKK